MITGEALLLGRKKKQTNGRMQKYDGEGSFFSLSSCMQTERIDVILTKGYVTREMLLVGTDSNVGMCYDRGVKKGGTNTFRWRRSREIRNKKKKKGVGDWMASDQ